MSSLSSEELWVPKAGAAETSLSPLTACVQCSDLSLVPASLVPGSCDQWGCPLVQILGDPWQHCLAVAGVGAVQCRVPPVPGVPPGKQSPEEWGSCGWGLSGQGLMARAHPTAQPGRGHLGGSPGAPRCAASGSGSAVPRAGQGCGELEPNPAGAGTDIPGSWHWLLECGLTGGAVGSGWDL